MIVVDTSDIPIGLLADLAKIRGNDMTIGSISKKYLIIEEVKNGRN